MLLASSGFVTICPKKEVELGADRHLHRANHEEELRQEISFEHPKATGNQYAYLPGGAVRAINPNSSMTLAEKDTCIAVFKGNLLNKAELAVQLLGCPAHVNEAQLLLHLYAALGLDMLGRLSGQYAFCLYDSKQARVLAARDQSGAVPLLEGRTAAGSLIIACGTFLPEGVTQMVEIKPGEYKYGWHALPRAFKCGEQRIVAGRASCDYGIRRRSIDAYNAPVRQSLDMPRQRSMDIPRHNSHHSSAAPTSHSYSHTPGRYMPPHAAAAAAAGAFSRQRATSLDGGHAAHNSHHLGTPPTAGRRGSEINTHSSSHKQPNHQQWMPRTPLAVAPIPEAAVAPKAAAPTPLLTPSDCQADQQEEVATPCSAASTPSTNGSEHHRRKRRHHRRSRHAAAAAASPNAAAAGSTDDGHVSETDSQVSSSTHDSTNSGPAAAAAAAAAPSKPIAVPAKQAGRRSSKDLGERRAAAAGPKAAGGHHHKPQQHHNKASGSQQQQPMRRTSASGFTRTGSCGELAALGSSPTAHTRSVLVAAPQGLAC